MIDIKSAKEEFEKYTNTYDQNKREIKVKIHHTHGVINEAKYICKSLKLNEEETNLALLIALLHDLGRFEQIKKYNTFVDAKSMDHAEYAVKILFKEKQIRKYIKEDTYDNVIKKAIFNHNKKNINTKNMNEQELLHSKIIRDADKADIFRVYCKEPIKVIISKGVTSDKLVTDIIYKEFFKKKAIDHKYVITVADSMVFVIAFVFDVNFKSVLLEIKERRYIDRIINRIKYTNVDTINKIDAIRKTAKLYIEDRLKEQ